MRWAFLLVPLLLVALLAKTKLTFLNKRKENGSHNNSDDSDLSNLWHSLKAKCIRNSRFVNPLAFFIIRCLTWNAWNEISVSVCARVTSPEPLIGLDMWYFEVYITICQANLILSLPVQFNFYLTRSSNLYQCSFSKSVQWTKHCYVACHVAL